MRNPTLAVLACLAGCVPQAKKPIHVYRAPPTPVDATGEASWSEEDGGRVVVQFSCVRQILEIYCVGCEKQERTEEAPCELVEDQEVEVTLISPWGTASSAPLTADGAAFEVDWAAAPLDPLAPDAVARVKQGWQLMSGETELAWEPADDLAARMLEAISDATGITAEVADEPRAVALHIADFRVTPAEVAAGDKVTLRVTVKNDGPGVAYRARVQTRSSVPSLHGHGLSFGKLEPGEFRTRSLDVAVPSDVAEPDAMIVLTVEEANHAQSATARQRVKIVGASQPDGARNAELAIRCHFLGKAGDERPEIDLRGPLKVRCVTRNLSGFTARTELVATLAGSSQPARETVEVESGKIGVAMFELQPPSDVALGSELVVQVTADGAETQKITAVVGTLGVCPSGSISRAEYKKKRAEMSKALNAGALTQEEFDRYDAELILCIE